MIYLFCPASIKTGGPEVLHQLAHKLNHFGFPATIFYYNLVPGRSPIVPEFEKYLVPYVTNLSYHKEDTLLFPETLIDTAAAFSNCRRIIWWLSVDFANFTPEAKTKLCEDAQLIHFVQSEYAKEYLLSEWSIPLAQLYFISDYVSSNYLNLSNPQFIQKRDVVLFNPYKGLKNTLELIAHSDSRILWRALKGLTTAGMQATLLDAKLYIDFGEHPGKDRIPREAALCGCCVVTNRKGSAANPIDVFIPEQYKLEEHLTIEERLNIIYEILGNFPESTQKFDSYREKTRNEFIQFEQDILFAFHQIYQKEHPLFLDEIDARKKITLALQEKNYSLGFYYICEYQRHQLPYSFSIYYLEAYIRFLIGEYHEAVYFAEKCLSLSEQHTETSLLLIQLYFELKEYKKSLHYAKQIIDQADPKIDTDLIAECLQYIKLIKEEMVRIQ